MAALQNIADLHQEFLFVGRPCRWCWRLFFHDAVDLHDEHYESDNKKVKCALKKDPVVDGGGSRPFGCGERGLWCHGQIEEHTHMGSYENAHSPVAKLWQNYRVRSGLASSSPASDSSVSD